MSTPDLAAMLKSLEDKYPFEARELERLQRRKWILRYARKGARTEGAEIGVFRGHFSEIICEVLGPKVLYLIDPWTQVGERFGWGKLAYTNDDALTTAHAKEEALTRCAQFPNTRTVPIETSFPVGCDKIENPLDWAYVDANHRYAPTLAHLRALEPMMKPDGVIMGDDWVPNPKHTHHGVFKAVHAFIRASNWHIVAAGPAGQWAIKRYA